MKKIILFIFSSIQLLGISQEQKNVVLLDNWTDTTIEKGLGDAVFNDVWSFRREGTDYCVIGSSIGTHFFRINNDQLELLDFEPGRYQDRLVIHRDFKVYGDYLYGVCDEGESSLQIFDLTYLPDSVSKVYDSPAHFQICHNIFIDTNKAKLYACGPNNIGLKVLDISTPTNPTLLHYYEGVDYVHDCYVRNDTAFLNAGFDGLYITYFGEDEPQLLGVIEFYPNQGYNHSGWLSPSGDKYAFIDESKGTQIKMCAWKNDLSSIEIIETFGTSNFEEYVPHNVVLLDNLAFISYYNEGLRIFDISKAPYSEIGIYDTFKPDTKYRLNGAWGVAVIEDKNQILIADRQGGLYLFSFPINVLNTPNDDTYVTNMPFLDQNSILVPREHLRSKGVSFSIATVSGEYVYLQENFLNYVNIPLELAPGMYVFSIYDEFGDLIENGKFLKGN